MQTALPWCLFMSTYFYLFICICFTYCTLFMCPYIFIYQSAFVLSIAIKIHVSTFLFLSSASGFIYRYLFVCLFIFFDLHLSYLLLSIQVCIYFYLSVYIFYPPCNQSLYLFLCMLVYLCAYFGPINALSTYLSIDISIHFAWQSTYLRTCLLTCLSVYLFTYLSICLCTYLFIYFRYIFPKIWLTLVAFFFNLCHFLKVVMAFLSWL